MSLVEEPFSTPVRVSLTQKIENYFRDGSGRQFIFVGVGPGLAGSETADEDDPFPTDVIVLLSDRYPSERADRNPIQPGGPRREFNRYLNAARARQVSLWLGVVQATKWKRIWVEGAALEQFASFLHQLHPGRDQFLNDARDPNVLDSAAEAAADLIFEHKPSECDVCGARSRAETAAGAPKAKPGGFLSRLFSSKG